jgi:GNAT superfamily N-acetyltransferase
MSDSVRRAVAADLPALVAMGRRFIAETHYHRHLSDNPAQIETIMRRFLHDTNGALFVIGPEAGPLGMLGVFTFAHPLDASPRASELFWWVEPEHRGHGLTLLRAAEAWAREQGATRLDMIAPDERTAAAYRALGYAKFEEHYSKDLQQP